MTLYPCGDCGKPCSAKDGRCWTCHQSRHTSLGEQRRRFWSHVDVRAPSECWEWMGSRNAGGYGRTTVNGRHVNASRGVFLLDGQNLSSEAVVCHTCDNPACVNPAHLYVGTASDNERDKIQRGRHAWHQRPQATCRRGHPRTDVRIAKDGTRFCRPCKRMSDNRRNARLAGVA